MHREQSVRDMYREKYEKKNKEDRRIRENQEIIMKQKCMNKISKNNYKKVIIYKKLFKIFKLIK